MCKDSCKQNRDELSRRPAGALYVHVPFCDAKCRYCDFFSLPYDAASASAFTAAAAAEIDARGECLARPLQSVFVGGGTPTVLGAGPMDTLLRAIRPRVDPQTEFTVEGNPGTIHAPVAEALVRAGVNRVSLGAQSFVDRELRLLGRRHRADEIDEAFQALRRAGVANLSLDLIFGIPGQDLAGWQCSLDRALSLGPEHLSCYGLTFESGTPLASDRQAGRLKEMDESLQEACYFAAVETAAAAGLEHYEISNFARQGRQCKQNLTYWNNNPYVGIGPGAASYLCGVRSTARADLDAYLGAIGAGEPAPASSEKLCGRHAVAEAMMLGLRLTQGIDRESFRAIWGLDPVREFAPVVTRYARLGALAITQSHLHLTRRGLFVSDTVFADLLAQA